jgi:GNAT superfamily N-acetyltransferase
MSAPETAPTDLIYRTATADDWPRIEEIVKSTWDDGDYITEDIWRNWATAPGSRLEAATRDGVIVSFAHLAELGPAEWWIEGVRVAKEFRGQGIGRALLAHMLDVFAEVGIGLLRLATNSQNAVMARLVMEFGFHSLISYAPVEAPAMPTDFRNFRLLQAQNLDIVYRYLRRSPMNKVNHFTEHHWTMYYLTQERLSAYLNNPDIQVLGFRHLDQLNGLAIVYPPDPGSTAMRLGYLDGGDDTTALAMLNAIQGVAAKRGYNSITWKMPIGIGLERGIGSTQFTRRRDYDITLYEKPLRG